MLTRTSHNIAKMASRIYHLQITPSQDNHTVATTKEILYRDEGMHRDYLTLDESGASKMQR